MPTHLPDIDPEHDKKIFTKSAWIYDREWFKSHHEAYKTETGALSLFSGHIEEKLEATIKNHGYFEWKPVYALNQRTFIKII